eukprot:m.86281 g.86281  ORF g.86281 m.86281 type:complete len:411 (-) comp19835_c0_seq1:1009-2241(-)
MIFGDLVAARPKHSCSLIDDGPRPPLSDCRAHHPLAIQSLHGAGRVHIALHRAFFSSLNLKNRCQSTAPVTSTAPRKQPAISAECHRVDVGRSTLHDLGGRQVPRGSIPTRPKVLGLGHAQPLSCSIWVDAEVFCCANEDFGCSRVEDSRPAHPVEAKMVDLRRKSLVEMIGSLALVRCARDPQRPARVDHMRSWTFLPWRPPSFGVDLLGVGRALGATHSDRDHTVVESKPRHPPRVLNQLDALPKPVVSRHSVAPHPHRSVRSHRCGVDRPDRERGNTVQREPVGVVNLRQDTHGGGGSVHTGCDGIAAAPQRAICGSNQHRLLACVDSDRSRVVCRLKRELRDPRCRRRRRTWTSSPSRALVPRDASKGRPAFVECPPGCLVPNAKNRTVVQHSHSKRCSRRAPHTL